jgi:tetratricopeptide (TPR) repeat protein
MMARRVVFLLMLLTSAGAGLMAGQDTPEAHLGRGYDALKLDRYEDAVMEFRAALRLDPKLVMRARFPLAVALFEMKNSSDARREFEAVRRELGDHPNILYYLGRLDLMDQNFQGAIANLTKAMASPPFPDTAYHLGFACLKLGDLAAAEKWLKVAAQANPADGAVEYQLGLVYRKEGRGQEAEKALALSTDLHRSAAEDSELRHECAQKLDQGSREEAHAVCARLYDANNAEKLTALGTIYGQHGDLPAALEPLRRAAELAPQSPQMQYNLAFTYYELGQFEEARAPIAKAVERWPDIFQLNSLYGAVLLKLSLEQEAWPVLRRAHQLNQQDARTAELLFRTTMSLARASLAAGENVNALRYFDEAAKLRPDDPEPRRGMAEARRDQK